MKINNRNFELALAKSCLTTRELEKLGKFSNATLAKMRSDPDYHPIPKTVGKLAKALNVSVEFLVAE